MPVGDDILGEGLLGDGPRVGDGADPPVEGWAKTAKTMDDAWDGVQMEAMSRM